MEKFIMNIKIVTAVDGIISVNEFSSKLDQDIDLIFENEMKKHQNKIIEKYGETFNENTKIFFSLEHDVNNTKAVCEVWYNTILELQKNVDINVSTMIISRLIKQLEKKHI